MISIDTKLMRELVAAANTANQNINTAMELLTSISSHQDWACKEKDAINDYSTTNKNKIRALHQDSQAFLQTISSVSEEFESTENSISDMFSGVESLLASIMSVTSGIGQAIQNLGPGGQLQPVLDTIKPKLNGITDKIWDIISPVPHTGYNHPQPPLGGVAGQLWEEALQPDLGFGGQAPIPGVTTTPGSLWQEAIQPDLGFGGQAPTPWQDAAQDSGTRINADGVVVYNMPGYRMDGMPVPEWMLSQESYTEGGLQGNSSVIDNIFNGIGTLPKLPSITPMETFSFKNLLQPLSLCSFKDIDLK